MKRLETGVKSSEPDTPPRLILLPVISELGYLGRRLHLLDDLILVMKGAHFGCDTSSAHSLYFERDER